MIDSKGSENDIYIYIYIFDDLEGWLGFVTGYQFRE